MVAQAGRTVRQGLAGYTSASPVFVMLEDGRQRWHPKVVHGIIVVGSCR